MHQQAFLALLQSILVLAMAVVTNCALTSEAPGAANLPDVAKMEKRQAQPQGRQIPGGSSPGYGSGNAYGGGYLGTYASGYVPGYGGSYGTGGGFRNGYSPEQSIAAGK